MTNRKRAVAQGIFAIMLVIGGGVIGVGIVPPDVEIVEAEKIVYVDRIVEVEKIVYVDNYDEGYNDGWNDMVIVHNNDMTEFANEWKEIVIERDNKWKQGVENAYIQGWNDAIDNTATDIFYVVKDLTPILKWLPV